MHRMKTRLSLVTAACGALCAAGLALLPATASAAMVQLGETPTPMVAPACPKGVSLADCKIVLAHTTAVEAMSDSLVNPVRVNQEGFIVSFSVGLSRLVPKATQRATIIKGLDAQYGGDPELQLTVLKVGPKNTYTVAGQSPVYPVLPFLGRVLDEPLGVPPKFTTFTALHVIRGELIALTVPTWAPVLSLDLPNTQFAYRQSRRANCIHPPSTQTAQTKLNQAAQYQCYYTGTRVQYTATELTMNKAPAHFAGQPTTAPAK
jgi:hypothetical protein